MNFGSARMLTTCSGAELVAGCCGGPCGPRALINMEGSAFETWRGRDGFRPSARHFPGLAASSLFLPNAEYPASVIVSTCASRILCLDRACSRFFRNAVSRHERWPRMRPARVRSTRMRRSTRDALRVPYRSVAFLLSSFLSFFFLFFTKDATLKTHNPRTYRCYFIINIIQQEFSKERFLTFPIVRSGFRTSLVE